MNIREYVDPRTFFKMPDDMQYKEYKKYSYNPFLIEEAKKVWDNKEINIVTRIFWTVLKGIKELFFINPYNLTLGNYFTYFENKQIEALNAQVKQRRNSKFETVKRYTKGVIKLCTLVVATAGALHVIGTSMIMGAKWIDGLGILGAKFTNIIKYIHKGGVGIKTLGRWMFLSLSVPTYTAFYKFPKFLINKIPVWIKAIGSFLSKHFVKIKEFLKPYYKVIGPYLVSLMEKVSTVLNACLTPFKWVFTNAIKPIATWGWSVIQSIGAWSVENVFFPLYNNVILSIFQTTINAYTNYLKPLLSWGWGIISTVGSFLYNKAILPIVTRAFALLQAFWAFVGPIAESWWSSFIEAKDAAIKAIVEIYGNIYGRVQPA